MSVAVGQTTRNTRITPCNARKYNAMLELKELLETNPVRSYERKVEAYRDYAKIIGRSVAWIEKTINERKWEYIPERFNGEAE